MMSSLSLCIVYDNNLHDKSLKSGWGFSCFLQRDQQKILFDTGDNPEKLLFNLNKLEIAPQDLSGIVLSHNHWDHTGGLSAVLGKARNCPVYFGKSYPHKFQQWIKAQGANFMLVEDRRSIGEGIFVGPEMGSLALREIPLIAQTDKGLVVITGCAHPGILKMVSRIQGEFNDAVYLVLGGFHLGISLELSAIAAGFKQLQVQKVAPGHCSGGRAIKLFREKFKQDFIPVGAGLKIRIE